MNPPTPVDPDKLRARLTQAVAPVTPSPDALFQIKAGARRRRRLRWGIGSGAGVVALAAGTAAIIGVASLAQPDASPRTVQPGYSPTSAPTTSVAPAPSVTAQPSRSDSPSHAAAAPIAAQSSLRPTPSTSVGGTTTPSAAASSAPTTTATVNSAAVTSAAVTPAAVVSVADDVDHDGTPDTAVVERSGTQATVVVHLAGRTVTSAPFDLGLGATAGRVTFASVNRDGRSEMLISGLGASAEPYYLFQYANGRITQVPAPAGQQEPWLVSGGGMNVDLVFGCTASGLVLSHAMPKSLADYNMNTASYVYNSATYRFQGDVLVKVAASSRTGLFRTQALALADAQPGDRCGAPM